MIGTRSLLYMMVLSVLQPPSAIGQDAERWPADLSFYLPRLMRLNRDAYSIQDISRQYGGDYDKAVKQFSEAIRLHANEASSYNNRGAAYLGKRDYEKAIKDFCEAIRLDPKMAAAYTNRGEVYAAKKEYDKAIQDHTKALTLDSTWEEALANRGRAYLKKKDYDRAIKDYTDAIRLNSYDGLASIPSLYLERGIAFGAQKDSDNAIGDFSEAISLHIWFNGRRPDWRCPQAYFYRGIAYLARKRYHLGFEDLKDYCRSITDKGSERTDEEW